MNKFSLILNIKDLSFLLDRKIKYYYYKCTDEIKRKNQDQKRST